MFHTLVNVICNFKISPKDLSFLSASFLVKVWFLTIKGTSSDSVTRTGASALANNTPNGFAVVKEIL